MNAGQRAMVTVKAIVDFKLNPEQKQLADSLQLNEGRVSQAATILRYRPDLADDVIAGRLPLNDAYEKARARKEGKDTDEARMAKLQAWRFAFDGGDCALMPTGHSQQRDDADAPKRRLLAVHLRGA
jgi:hypothetical protein